MWGKNKHYFLLMPALTVTVLLFGGGIIYGLAQSLGLSPLTGDPGFTLNAYVQLLSSADFWNSFVFTFRVSLLSTLGAVILALFVLYFLYLIRIRSKKDKSIYFQRFFQVSMLFPYIISAYMIFLMFIQSGWVARILYKAGFISGMSSFPVITNDSFGAGIIIAYIWKTSPFIVLLLYPVILKVEMQLIESAKILGADYFRTFREIVLPMLRGPLETAALIVFAYTSGAFEVPCILGITYRRALSVLSYLTFRTGALSERPEALAVNILMLSGVFIFVIIYFCTSRIIASARGGKK